MRHTKAKAPAFQLYAGDFLTDVMDWTDEEVGAHIRLLCWSWVNRRGIPRCIQRCTRIAPAVERAWPTIGAKWVEGPDDTYINERLEATRQDSDAFRARQRDKSLKAVEVRREHHHTADAATSPPGVPVGTSGGSPTGTSTGDPRPGVPPGHPLEGEGEDIRNIERMDKRKRTPAPVPELFVVFHSAEFKTAMDGFVAMRQAKRKPMTTQARKLIMADLAKMGEADAIRALNNSTRAGWTDVYPPKANNHTTTEKAQATIMARDQRPEPIRSMLNPTTPKENAG